MSTAVDKRSEVSSAFAAEQPLEVITPTLSVARLVDRVQLEWINSNIEPVTYNLYYSSISPHVYDQVISGITGSEYTFSNTVAGTTYYFAITAMDTNGVESDLSEQYAFLMPLTLEMSFTFESAATNVSVQSSNDLMIWQASRARPGAAGLWRIDVNPGTRAEFYRGIGQAVPAL